MNFSCRNVSDDAAVVVKSASWECSKHCAGCAFSVDAPAPVGECAEYRRRLRLVFTQTVSPEEDDLLGGIGRTLSGGGGAVYVAVASAVVLTSCLLLAAFLYCKRCRGTRNKAVSPLQKQQHQDRQAKSGVVASLRELSRRHLGNRLSLWRASEPKEAREDALQNALLLLDGAMAVVFACEWQGDNNPLLAVRDKFRGGVTLSEEVLDASGLGEFALRLNRMALSANAASAAFCFAVVVAWCVTVTGTRNGWTRVRRSHFFKEPSSLPKKKESRVATYGS